MRFIIMMASILIVSILIFKGYSNYLTSSQDELVGREQLDPVVKANEVNELIKDATSVQRQELEKQIQ